MKIGGRQREQNQRVERAVDLCRMQGQTSLGAAGQKSEVDQGVEGNAVRRKGHRPGQSATVAVTAAVQKATQAAKGQSQENRRDDGRCHND